MRSAAQERMSTDTRSITEFYEGDHDRLDGLFRSFLQLKRTNFEKAGCCFREFQAGLLQHMLWEEEILFPLFERKTGQEEGGPTHAMRLEHGVIRTHLDRIRERVQLRSEETDDAERELLEALSAHSKREEQMLYPAIDTAIEEDERSHIFRSMRRSCEDLLP